jgi:hypothetical protein
VEVGAQTLANMILDTGSSDLLAADAGCEACHPVAPQGSNYTVFSGLNASADVVANASAR